MDEVDALLDAIGDRVVVTSDHGNMLGGRNWPVPTRTYGHPMNLRTAGLTRVPWLVRDGERRDVTDDGTSVSATSGQDVEERLSELGYLA